MDDIDKRPTGLGVDSSGGPVIDPTANVIQLVINAVNRLDDLRKSDTKRLEDLQVSELRHISEIMKLRAEYQEKLAVAESKRIDAIRAVDVGAVAIASERASRQADVLATQISQSTEQLIERVAALEKSSYVGSGKQAVADPMMVELLAEVRRLRRSRDTDTGQQEGKTAMWSYVTAAIGIIFGVSGIVIAIISLTKG